MNALTKGNLIFIAATFVFRSIISTSLTYVYSQSKTFLFVNSLLDIFATIVFLVVIYLEQRQQRNTETQNHDSS